MSKTLPKLDNETKLVAEAFFDKMNPDGESFLLSRLNQTAPSKEILKALNILEYKGLVKREIFEDGSMKYFPLVSFR